MKSRLGENKTFDLIEENTKTHGSKSQSPKLSFNHGNVSFPVTIGASVKSISPKDDHVPA